MARKPTLKNGHRKRPRDVGPEMYCMSVRIPTVIAKRLREQADKEHRPMANLAALFIQSGLDDRQRGGN